MVTKKDKTLAAAQKFLERGQLDKALAEFAQGRPGGSQGHAHLAEDGGDSTPSAARPTEAREIYLRTGELYIEQGFFQKAVAVYKNVLKLSPGLRRRCTSSWRRSTSELGLVSDAVHQFELAAADLPADRAADGGAGRAARRSSSSTPDNVVSRIKLAEAASQAGADRRGDPASSRARPSS